MEYFELILSLVGTCLGLLITSSAFIIKFAKNVKAKESAEQTLEICNAILPYVEQAEKLINFNGEEKKEFVMVKVNQYALKHGIKFDEKEVSDKVEELIALSKNVNFKSESNKKVIKFPIGNCKE